MSTDETCTPRRVGEGHEEDRTGSLSRSNSTSNFLPSSTVNIGQDCGFDEHCGYEGGEPPRDSPLASDCESYEGEPLIICLKPPLLEGTRGEDSVSQISRSSSLPVVKEDMREEEGVVEQQLLSSARKGPFHTANSIFEMSPAQTIMSHLTFGNEAMQGVMLNPSVLRRMDKVILALKASFSTSDSADGKEKWANPVNQLLFEALKSQSLGSIGHTRRKRAILVFVGAGLLASLLLKRLSRVACVATLLSFLSVGFLALFTVTRDIRSVLVSPSPTRMCTFSLACKNIVLLKAAQSFLTEARIACSRHHITNTVGANILHTQQESLYLSLVSSGILSNAAKGATARASSLDDLDVIILQSQSALWELVRGMALLSADSSYAATFSDLRRFVVSTRQLTNKRKELEELHNRLMEFSTIDSTDEKQRDAIESSPSPTMERSAYRYQELYSHAQRLSGQLYLLRSLGVVEEISEEERRQAMRDVADAVSALVSAWQRAAVIDSSVAITSSGANRPCVGSVIEEGDDDGAPSKAKGHAPPAYSELSGQGEDPVPLYPDDAYDDDIGANRAALPDNFAEMLIAMKRKR